MSVPDHVKEILVGDDDEGRDFNVMFERLTGEHNRLLDKVASFKKEWERLSSLSAIRDATDLAENVLQLRSKPHVARERVDLPLPTRRDDANNRTSPVVAAGRSTPSDVSNGRVAYPSFTDSICSEDSAGGTQPMSVVEKSRLAALERLERFNDKKDPAGTVGVNIDIAEPRTLEKGDDQHQDKVSGPAVEGCSPSNTIAVAPPLPMTVETMNVPVSVADMTARTVDEHPTKIKNSWKKLSKEGNSHSRKNRTDTETDKQSKLTMSVLLAKVGSVGTVLSCW